MKKILSLLLVLVMVFALCAPAMAAEENPLPEGWTPADGARMGELPEGWMPADGARVGGDIVILHSNDVHGEYKKYTNMAAYKDAMIAEGNDVVLVDAGDFSQGAAIAILSKGEYLVELVNAVGYDVVVPGNHEFDYGIDQALKNLDDVNATVVSCNFVDLQANKPVYDAYTVKEFGDVKVAFVGISTPETYTKSTPTYFQNEAGEYIYSFSEDKFYETIQTAVDEAAAAADYVVAVGHLGVDESSSPWTSKEVIANTTGIDVFIDGHSHTKINGEAVVNKDGKDVVLAQTGTKLATIGKVTIKADGTITAELVDVPEETSAAVDEVTAGITANFAEYTAQVVATSEVDLQMTDANGVRLVRNAETNLGDMIADAYRVVMGADIGLMNGGGIRANVAAGEVKMDDILAVMTFGNMATVVELTGQQIIDCLEMGAAAWPGETGGFTHVSGMTYTIDATVKSSIVKDDKGNFAGVEGDRRVQNVMVAGEPIDLEKTYSVACHSYWLTQYGDGMVMFKGGKIVDEKHEMYVDNVMLVKYIQENLGGNITAAEYGEPQGRITIDDPLGKFADVDRNAWYADAVATVVRAGVLKGTDKGFEPASLLTTASVIQTLYNMNNEAEAAAEGEPWYAPAMNWAAEAGLYEAEGFEDSEIVRGDVVKIMDAYCAMKGIVGATLFQGNENGDMMLDKTLTRMEWAQVLTNLANVPMPLAG